MKALLLAFAFSVTAIGSMAQSADDIVAKHVKATGGKKWGQLKNIIQKSEMTMQGITMTVTVTQSSPNKYHSKIWSAAMQIHIIEGFDGETAWTINPLMGGKQKLPEERQKAAKEGYIGNPFWNYKDRGMKLKYEGTEKVDGTDCFKIKVTKNGKEDFHYFDKSSYYLIKTESTSKGPDGAEVTVSSHYDDFRDVDGLKFPYQSEMRMDGETMQTMKTEEILVNSKVLSSIFVMPED